jgi:hypothetical protein
MEHKEGQTATLRFEDTGAFLRLEEVGGTVAHGTAFGRVAFAVPAEKLPAIEKAVKDDGKGKVLTPLVKLVRYETDTLLIMAFR